VNLAEIIDDHAPESTALIWNNRATTYGELRTQVDHVRGGLAALGVGDGHRVALVLTNGVPFVVTYLAALGLGAVAVPLNPTSPAPELESEITTVGATVVVIDRSVSATWAAVDPEAVPTVTTVVTTDPAAPADSELVPFDRLLEAEPVGRTDVEPDHLAALLFTSGTAGAPRAAMLTHGNLRANIDQSLSANGHMSGDDVVYGVLPLFHIFGLNVVLGLALTVGATVVLVQRFDPTTALQSIADRGITVIPGAPGMWAAFTQLDDVPADAFATVRLALSGAARLALSVGAAMLDRFGVEVLEGYGLTEASPIVTTSTGAPARPGSVGRALHGVEVRLVNINGDALVGDVGEVWVRGDNVFAGYLDDPEATAAVLNEDGWLLTGDMATADDDGYLYLVDRAKDLVIVSGFNVYPAEVEETLMTHPDVVEAGVVGVAHPHTGEAVKAYVVLQPGSLVDEETLIDYSLDHLARYKCPSKIIFVESLPRNTSGKLVRRSLDDALRIGLSPTT
jgi:long-chain acyl-CoA synthetase